jgi:hypothetical protein
MCASYWSWSTNVIQQTLVVTRVQPLLFRMLDAMLYHSGQVKRIIAMRHLSYIDSQTREWYVSYPH